MKLNLIFAHIVNKLTLLLLTFVLYDIYWLTNVLILTNVTTLCFFPWKCESIAIQITSCKLCNFQINEKWFEFYVYIKMKSKFNTEKADLNNSVFVACQRIIINEIKESYNVMYIFIICIYVCRHYYLCMYVCIYTYICLYIKFPQSSLHKIDVFLWALFDVSFAQILFHCIRYFLFYCLYKYNVKNVL